MSAGDPFSEIVSFFFGVLTIILWLVTFARIGRIRDEARRQTELLAEIARNTRRPDTDTKSTQAPSVNYMRDPQAKTSIGWFLGVLAVFATVLFVLAMASKR